MSTTLIKIKIKFKNGKKKRSVNKYWHLQPVEG